MLDLQTPDVRGLPRADRAPAGDRRRRGAVACSATSGDRLWVALILASLPVAGRGRLPARADRVHAARRRGRRRAAADALRLRVPGRARLHRHPVHGAGRVGGGAGGAAPARAASPVLVLLALAGLLRPEAWVLAAPVLVLGGVAGELAAARCCTPRWPRSARCCGRSTDYAVTGDPLFSLHYTSGSAEDLGPPAPLVAAAVGDPGVLRQPRQAAGAGRGGARPRARGRCCRRGGRRCRSRCSSPGIVDVRADRRRRRVGDRALPGRRRGRAARVRRRSPSAASRCCEPGRLRTGWMVASVAASSSSASCSRRPTSTSRCFDAELSFRGAAHDDLVRGAARPGGAGGAALRAADAAQPQARARLALDRRPARRARSAPAPTRSSSRSRARASGSSSPAASRCSSTPRRARRDSRADPGRRRRASSA